MVVQFKATEQTLLSSYLITQVKNSILYSMWWYKKNNICRDCLENSTKVSDVV